MGNSDALYFYILINGAGHENVKVTVHHFTLLVEAHGNDKFKPYRRFEKSVCWIDLPDIDSPNKRCNVNGIKAERVFSVLFSSY